VIKQFVPQEYCLKCQGCCRFKEANSVWSPCLLDEEVQDLLDRKITSASIDLGRKIQPIPNPKQEGFICPFLNSEDNKCKIYEFRPFECQLYPFLISLRDNKVLLTIDLNCLYAQENLKTQEFKDYTKYLTTFLNSAAQKRIIKDNPHIIQAYEEVLDVIELQIE
jgi:uncharacterized protein